MKLRHICASLGAAIAVGVVVFTESLLATNNYQALAVAERLVKALPIAPGTKIVSLAVDHRPGGRVMQGPPMMATIAVDDSLEEGAVAVTRALFASRRLSAPALGSQLNLVGRNEAYKLKVSRIISWDRPLRGYPNAFVSSSTARKISERWQDWAEKTPEELAPGFASDANRNFDRAKMLMLWAAALTALSLLVNSILLSVEARRREIATLRMLGMTRFGVLGLVARESFALACAGWIIGVAVSLFSLWIYVKFDFVTFPSGMAISWRSIVFTAAAVLPISLMAVLISLKRAFSVRPAEVSSRHKPLKSHVGMLIAFSCGFGAFVAVEVWGASLMSAFIPSPEWPDAIVSILPGGVSSFDIEKVSGQIKGVKKIRELQPLQVNVEPLEQMKGRGGLKQYRNVLLLASDWLPDFRFSRGDRERALKAVISGDNCIITEMMARARNLKLGDELKLDAGMGLKVALKIAGIVDLNWHMVTSRGLLRGLRRMPVMTDGPVFVSFDTLDACDHRPSATVKMTHLWLDYDQEFLDRHGVFAAGRIVEKEIVKALGLTDETVGKNAVRLHARDEISDGTLHHGASIVGSMARVPFIFVAVVSLGFIAMLAASVQSRRDEFKVLCAVGMTRVQLAAVLATEAVKVALAGIVNGTLGGSLAGWLFTATTRAAMPNWGIPPSFAFPFADVALGAFWSLVFAAAVAVPAALLIIGKRK